MFLAKTLVLAGTLGAVALATPAAASGSQTLHLTAKIAHTKMIALAPKHPSVGDEQVASGTLVTDSRRPAGRFGVTCTWVAVYQGHVLDRCDGWATLAGGQLTFAGMSRTGTNRHTLAITGGTGVYQAARGQIQLYDVNDRETRVAVTLIS